VRRRYERAPAVGHMVMVEQREGVERKLAPIFMYFWSTGGSRRTDPDDHSRLKTWTAALHSPNTPSLPLLLTTPPS